MWNRLRWPVLLSVATLGFAAPHEREGREEPDDPEPSILIRAAPTPTDFYNMALVDASLLPLEDAKFTRYIAHSGDLLSVIKTTSLAMNTNSRAPWIKRPIPIFGGYLCRIDLRWYATKTADLGEWFGFWEELAFDPMFSQIITRDVLDLIQEDSLNPEEVKQIQLLKEAKVDAIRFNGKHIDQRLQLSLQSLLSTQAPIVDHRYLKHRLMTTIKDDKAYAVVFGGRYYEFRGIKKAKDVLGKDTKATDLDLFFENLGIGNIKAGVTADKLFDNLRSDQRSIMVRSNVTGKPRDILSFHTPAAQEVGSWGAITGDVKDGSIDVKDRSFANLAKPREEAREAIFPGPNGHTLYALFNGEGSLQNEVPPEIAHDTTIPNPYTKRLQAPRGCIICHGTDGSANWKPFTNDAKSLIRKGFDVFDDRGGGKERITQDLIYRIAGQYLGNPAKHLRRAREDASEVYLKTTGPWAGGGDQTEAFKFTALQLEKDMNGYWYTQVDARQALLEEGWDVPADKALGIFQLLHPPDERARVGGVYLEDTRVALLRAGVAISRSDWALVYSHTMERSLRSPFHKELAKVAKSLTWRKR